MEDGVRKRTAGGVVVKGTFEKGVQFKKKAGAVDERRENRLGGVGGGGERRGGRCQSARRNQIVWGGKRKSGH